VHEDTSQHSVQKDTVSSDSGFVTTVSSTLHHTQSASETASLLPRSQSEESVTLSHDSEGISHNGPHLDAVRSTDSDVQSDDLSPSTKQKTVAIDISQNQHFTRRLLPVQSPEFDNVIDQVQ